MPRVRGDPDDNDRVATRIGRRRRPLSCLPCRSRKLRCDRAIPACGNCVNRGEITACSYAIRKGDSRNKPEEPSTLSDGAQERIDHLEQLVLTLLKNAQDGQKQVDTPSSVVDVDHDTNSISDRMLVENSDQEPLGDRELHNRRATSNSTNSQPAITIGAYYKQSNAVDEAHWALLLNEIGEVRSHLLMQQRQYEEHAKKMTQFPKIDNCGPALLFGSGRQATRAEILSQLPSRYTCDIIVARFWAHLYPAVYILHRPSFNRQYERFWVDESSTSIIWIGLLFAILRIGVLDYVREGDEPLEFRGKCQDFASNFRNSFTDCLILGDYLQPHDFLIEAFNLHLYGEYVSSRDIKSSVWILIGMIIRLAMRMGYHQQAQPALASTPFKAEMRLRNWAYLRQADILISFQLGLPSMVGVYSLDFPLPRNINDDEAFDEDSTVLPAALPDSEPTQISYLLMKSKLAFGFARVVEEINCADAIRWERILEIDRKLRHIYDSVPDHWKLGQQLSSRDSLVLTSARFVLASIHHISLCVVHSRFLEIAKIDYRYVYSRRVCLSSAMTILRFQAIQNQEIPVDGHVRSLTNYQNALAIHDYLLAATIISADLSSNTSTGASAKHPSLQGMPTRAEMIKALALSARIFRQSRDRSMEAFKAADVLEMLVSKFEADGHNPAQKPANGRTRQPNQASRSNSTCLMSPESTAHPPSSRDSCRDGICNSSVANTTLVADQATSKTITRPPYHFPHRSSLTSYGPTTETSLQPKPGFWALTEQDTLTPWSDNQENNLCLPAPPVPPMFPEFETSTDWTISQDPEIPPEPYSSNPVVETTSTEARRLASESSNTANIPLPLDNSISYSASTVFTDPMSTLWNLSTGTRGVF